MPGSVERVAQSTEAKETERKGSEIPMCAKAKGESHDRKQSKALEDVQYYGLEPSKRTQTDSGRDRSE